MMMMIDVKLHSLYLMKDWTLCNIILR
jgi:hypothetical protein